MAGSKITVTIYWSTKDRAVINEIMKEMNLPDHMTINRETTADLKKEDYPLLDEYVKKKLIQIRKR
jgi:hypothetical protein|nr:MAG TPA: hypothetical protein [Caudoviricetes sp.]